MALFVTPKYLAEMVTYVVLVTLMVAMVNVALVLPAGTVTVEGSLAADELSLSVTTTPPDGAAEVRVTVPWEEVPPVTLVGLTDNALKATAGFTVSVAVFVTPP
jgi:hypothetical protein